jgi:hypothetical protein
MSDAETAALSALLWAEGPGRVFFSNALLRGRAEQVRLTLERLETIRDAARASSAPRAVVS